MKINPVAMSGYLAYPAVTAKPVATADNTQADKNTIEEDTPQATKPLWAGIYAKPFTKEELLAAMRGEVKQEAWTDEEYWVAVDKMESAETKKELDYIAFIAEDARRSAIRERDNLFVRRLRDLGNGVVKNEMGDEKKCGYNSDIFRDFASTFSRERKIISKNFGGYLTDEEVDYRLKRLNKQFDDTVGDLAQMISHYASKDLKKDIKAYGELIKWYVNSGNFVGRDDDASGLYSYLNDNREKVGASLSIDEINAQGRRGYSSDFSQGTALNLEYYNLNFSVFT